MVKYSKVIENNNYSEMNQLSNNSVKWLWVNDYFDGPLAGIVKIESSMYFATLAQESEDEYKEGWFRKYWIIKLSEEQLKEEIYWHNEFCKHVGMHFTCNEEGKLMRSEKYFLKITGVNSIIRTRQITNQIFSIMKLLVGYKSSKIIKLSR
jgi:hypothetical protein